MELTLPCKLKLVVTPSILANSSIFEPAQVIRGSTDHNHPRVIQRLTDIVVVTSTDPQAKVTTSNSLPIFTGVGSMVIWIPAIAFDNVLLFHSGEYTLEYYSFSDRYAPVFRSLDDVYQNVKDQLVSNMLFSYSKNELKAIFRDVNVNTRMTPPYHHYTITTPLSIFQRYSVQTTEYLSRLQELVDAKVLECF